MASQIQPLDPITAGEITKASVILRQRFDGSKIHFKVVDLIEAPKAVVWKRIDGGIRTVDRKARIYFHANGLPHLAKARVNITKGEVEAVEEFPRCTRTSRLRRVGEGARGVQLASRRPKRDRQNETTSRRSHGQRSMVLWH